MLISFLTGICRNLKVRTLKQSTLSLMPRSHLSKVIGLRHLNSTLNMRTAIAHIAGLSGLEFAHWRVVFIYYFTGEYYC